VTPTSLSYRTPREMLETHVIILGIILLVLGLLIPAIHVLLWIGLVLLVIGVVLAVAGFAGREIGGRRHWY
jgi:membrane protein implicated in regulation of membrane protease activity